MLCCFITISIASMNTGLSFASSKPDAYAAGTMRASIILFFGATTLFTVISYLAAGLITAQSLSLALLVAPAYALGLFAGARAFRFASPEIFRRLCFLLIAISVITSLPLWR